MRTGLTPAIAEHLKAKSQFIRFAGIGAIGTLVHWLILIIAVSRGLMNPLPATSIGAVCGALTNYVLNYRYTFHSRARHVEALSRFLLLGAVGVGLNAGIVALLAALGLHYLIAQLAATASVLLINFAASKQWVFQRSTK